MWGIYATPIKGNQKENAHLDGVPYFATFDKRMHICIYIYIYVYIIYISTYLHIYISTYLHIYISTYLHIYKYTYTHIYIYIYICIIYIYIYMHVYLETLCVLEGMGREGKKEKRVRVDG